MNKIVRNYPASKWPADLRPSENLDARVTVLVEEEQPPQKIPSLDEIFAARRAPYRSKEEIDSELRKQREEWDD